MQRLLRLLADPTRLRILASVEGEELAVNEIADVLGMGQSRISNHLRLLRDAGALHARREGAWTFYRNALSQRDETAALWTAVLAGLAGDRDHARDRDRRARVLEERRERSRAHFARGNGRASPALERETLRFEILGALAPPALTVLDAGCGDGSLTELLAARFDRVVAVDHAPERLAEARRRVRADHVTFEQGEIDALPLEDGSVDAVFLSLVLHHVPAVADALREARRVLRPGGRLVVADLAPHDEESMRETMGDLRLGLDPNELERALVDAGFVRVRTRVARDRLVAGRRKLLELFVATADRPERRRRGTTGRKRSRT